MRKDWEEPSDEDSIACHLQQEGMGSMLCRAARQGQYATNETTPVICFNCEAGKIYREVGCESVTPRLKIISASGGALLQLDRLFCKVRKRDTSLDHCRTCNLVLAETTKQLMGVARGLFEAHGFYSAYCDLEAARKAMRDGEYDHTITRSVACFESVMRVCHDTLGQELLGGKQVTDLWRSTRGILRFNELEDSKETARALNSLSGVVINLAGLRNALSDAHGRGAVPPVVSEITAELALNTAMTLSTAVIRRFIQIRGGEHGND